ncbi:MAG: hypothetical protein IID40_03215 [Planctomycetes bacterium]|nr:hypothetical protein [Planctomycetota bacterium]
MTERPPRFAGEYHGLCQSCDAHNSFSFGFADDREPRAITWEGPDCIPISIRDLQLIRQVDDALWISVTYACSACNHWNTIKTDARAEPG